METVTVDQLTVENSLLDLSDMSYDELERLSEALAHEQKRIFRRMRELTSGVEQKHE